VTRAPKVKGVCAVCRVDAGPDHFHTPTHLDAAAAWERKHRREQAANQPPRGEA